MILAHQKFSARIIAKQYLSKIKENSIEKLRELRYFSDSREVSFHNIVVPTLIDKAYNSNNSKDAIVDLFTSFLDDAHGIIS
mmetsp:Transcript_18497/g.3015  ORF Transcript_18497/g.3015 Transcript_18497/m.3015 type:complete len:82 (+) Transcript_18497:734-979(+)